MATKRMIARSKKCVRLATMKMEKRKQLRGLVKDQNVDFVEKMQIVAKLNKCKRDESFVRVQRRCEQCGRVHGVYRKFKLCRLCLRKVAMFGNVPGLRKASW